MIRGFKDFILRGNVIDLAVAVVIGAAFTALVTAVTTGLIQPVINMIFGLIGIGADGVGGTVAIPGGQTINLGLIITAVITFLITAAVVYFIFVAPMNAAKERFARPAEEELAEETALLREIRDLLKVQRPAAVDLTEQKAQNDA
jgi:large conductance mechanosensitive channel